MKQRAACGLLYFLRFEHGVGADVGASRLKRPRPVMDLQSFQPAVGPSGVETVPFGQEILERSGCRLLRGAFRPVHTAEFHATSRESPPRAVPDALAIVAHAHRRPVAREM